MEDTASGDGILKRKRRPRYKGTHPRRFDEKYKELNPEKYADDVEKIIKSGKTPAGMHRPICVEEIMRVLDPKPGQTGLDATLGFGGHTQELLGRILPGGRLFGIDVDPIEITRTEARLRALGFGDEVLIIKQINFAGIHKLLALAVGGFDFMLADLGVSSMQLDNPARGFTFKWRGPLDLRFNPRRGQPASALIKSVSEAALEKILFDNADEPYSQELARVIYEKRNKISTTNMLTDTIRETLSSVAPKASLEQINTSIRRVFQALRIEVNDEFSALEQFLRNLPICLKPCGRAAVLTFHSGEDKRVMKSFEEGLSAGIYSDISREAIRPTAQECFDNPRAKSAVLRWAIRGSDTTHY